MTALMGWFASTVGMNYKRGGLLPNTDSAYVEYERFLSQFSEDGNVMVVGVEDERLYTPEGFTAWYRLGNDLRTMDEATRAMLVDPEVLAIDQDPLGRQGVRLSSQDAREAWAQWGRGSRGGRARRPG